MDGSDVGTLADPASACENVDQLEQEGSTGKHREERPAYAIGFDPEEPITPPTIPTTRVPRMLNVSP